MWRLWICGWILIRRVGSVLQVVGVLVGSVSAYIIHPAVGGLFLSAGLILFGLSLESSGEV